jgi:hypothetical protein
MKFVIQFTRNKYECIGTPYKCYSYLENFILYLSLGKKAITDVINDIYIYLFIYLFNCNWVLARWQQ